jgi:glycosyltransferase involved in cell wall biosynthesis
VVCDDPLAVEPSPAEAGSSSMTGGTTTTPPGRTRLSNRGSAMRLGITVLRPQIPARFHQARRQFIFLSHPIDGSGAPNILMSVLEEFAERFEAGQIHVVAPYIKEPQLRRLERLGIRISGRVFGADGPVRPRLIQLQLRFRRDDFVLMNTIAVPEHYQRAVLSALGAGRLAHAFWFIHEDAAQHKRFAPHLLDPAFRRSVSEFIERGQLTVIVPSKKLKRDYDALFGTAKVESFLYRFDLPMKYRREREESDYARINFLLSGPPDDGRKGHVIALFAFENFLTTYYSAKPQDYREFAVTFVGIGDDFLSRQVAMIGNAVLGDRFRSLPNMPHDEALEQTRHANTVICCSMSEGCPLYVTEAMMMGHVVIRNESGGLDEQLEDGVNGFLIEGDSIDSFADVIDRVLSKSRTSNERLWEMGKASQELSEPFRHQSYVSAFRAE